MAKSIKLKNNTYIDSTGIIHEKELLSIIINNSAIYDSGANSNGSYIRYKNGIMICYHSILKSNVAFTKNTSGTYYFINENYEHLYDWTYPQQFIGVPKVITTVSSSGYVNACCGNISRTAARVLSTTNYNTSTNITFNMVAIGKWK